MSEEKATSTKRKMTQEEIEIARKSVTQRKMTPEEIEEGEKYKKLLRRVESTGKWWELWDRKEAKEFFVELKCEKNVKNAIKELKKIFTDEWFKSYLFIIDAALERDLNKGIISKELENIFADKKIPVSKKAAVKGKDNNWLITDREKCYMVRKENENLKVYLHEHPIKPWLYNPTFAPSIAGLIPLGTAITILDGAEKLTKRTRRGLKDAQNFKQTAYEMIVKAFLKTTYNNSTVTFPDEKTPYKGPDVKVDNVTFEIKTLDSSNKYQNSINEELKELTDTLKEKFKGYKGLVSCGINFGQPIELNEVIKTLNTAKELNEVIKSIKTAKMLIDSLDVKSEEKVTITKDGINVNINLVPSNKKSFSCSMKGFGHPEVYDLERMVRTLLVEEIPKKFLDDLPMIVVIRPSPPMAALKDKEFKENIAVVLFKEAILQEQKIKKVKELWIDLSFFINTMEEVIVNPILSLSRSFVKIANPSFEEPISNFG